MMLRFPKDLYTVVRTSNGGGSAIGIVNGEVRNVGEERFANALIRVFDGEMWYESRVNELSSIQEELDLLAELAAPNPGIGEHPIVAKYEVHQVTVDDYGGEKDCSGISSEQWKEMLENYLKACAPDGIPECVDYYGAIGVSKGTRSFYSSKGAAVIKTGQCCFLQIGYGFTVDGVTTYGGKYYSKNTLEEIVGREKEICECRDRYLDFARNAKYVEPGDYTCVFSPNATALFTHEIFGHRSEADNILHDQALQEEWTLGKRVGSEKVSIFDEGGQKQGVDISYDDEGTKTRKTWLIQNGVLTGRLHDVKSAVALGEELTGNARANGIAFAQVRMTNTAMAAGEDDPEEIIRGVKDGIYLYNVRSGTGGETFTIQPDICYRIRDGKLCEPVRANVMTGSVHQALFDVDAVGTDFTWFDDFSCTKGGQSLSVGCGGPTIRIRKLTVS